jgi:hypothetical protein
MQFQRATLRADGREALISSVPGDAQRKFAWLRSARGIATAVAVLAIGGFIAALWLGPPGAQIRVEVKGYDPTNNLVVLRITNPTSSVIMFNLLEPPNGWMKIRDKDDLAI